MPAPLGNPVFYATDQDGAPLAGGQLFAYVAGTSTPQDTYTDSTLATANANPVILDSSGRAQVWCPDDSVYKFVLEDSTGTVIWTIDDVAPAQAFPSPYPTQFTDELNPVAYVSATSFKVTGVDVTSVYTVGRIVRSVNTGGTIYSQVKSSAFSTDTTVTVDNFSGTLDAGLSAVSYGLITAAASSLPAQNSNKSFVFVSGNTGSLVSATDAVLGNSTYTGTVLVDTLSEFSTSTGRFVPKVSGKYRVAVNCGVTISGVTFTAGGIGVQTKIRKGGTAGNGGTLNHAVPIGTTATLTAGGNGSYVFDLTAGGGSDYIDVAVNATFSGGTPVPQWTITIERVQ